MKLSDELLNENIQHFEEWERSAREERRKSVDWKRVRKTCTSEQIKGIELFVEYRLYEAAASIAKMDLYDFIRLLEKLGIARG